MDPDNVDRDLPDLTPFQADVLRQLTDRLNDRPVEVLPDVEPDTYGLTWDEMAAEQETLRVFLGRLADLLEV
jgi:hypothetical protein